MHWFVQHILAFVAAALTFIVVSLLVGRLPLGVAGLLTVAVAVVSILVSAAYIWVLARLGGPVLSPSATAAVVALCYGGALVAMLQGIFTPPEAIVFLAFILFALGGWANARRRARGGGR